MARASSTKRTTAEPVPDTLAADIAAAAITMDDGAGAPKSASEAAPASAAPRSKRDAAPKPGRPSKGTKRREALIGTLALVGTGLSMVDRYDGAVVLATAENVADALTAAAEQVPALARAIDALNNTSAWGAVAAAILPVAVLIAANHGAVPQTAATAMAGTIHETAMAIAGEPTWPRPKAAPKSRKSSTAPAPAVAESEQGNSWQTAA